MAQWPGSEGGKGKEVNPVREPVLPKLQPLMKPFMAIARFFKCWEGDQVLYAVQVGMMECLGSSIEMCKVTETLREPNHGCNLNFRRRHWQQRKRMQRSFSLRQTAAMRSTSSCLIPWPVLEPASAMHDVARCPTAILNFVSIWSCKHAYVYQGKLCAHLSLAKKALGQQHSIMP